MMFQRLPEAKIARTSCFAALHTELLIVSSNPLYDAHFFFSDTSVITFLMAPVMVALQGVAGNWFLLLDAMRETCIYEQ